jgi:oligopeptide/dipeptide ABC transporter ATP-binding protein
MTALLALAALAVAGPLLWGSDAAIIHVAALNQGPSSRHWLGTDNLGRDILARVLTAARLSLSLSVTATLLGATGGIAVGILGGVLGLRCQRAISAVVNMALAFPALLVAMFMAIILGVGARGALFAIAIASAPAFARLAQTLTASVAGTDYLAAAKVLGVSRRRLLLRHILPNASEPLILIVTFSMSEALLALSGLSYLGLGVQPPSYDWGLLLNQGLNRIYITPVAALAPGAAIVLAGLSFNLIGEELKKATASRWQAPAKWSWLKRVLIPPRYLDIEGLDDATRVAQISHSGEDVLQVVDLSVNISTPLGTATPVRDVSFDVGRGEIVGIVGESGSGKSLLGLAIAQLLPSLAQASARELQFCGQDLRALAPRELRQFLGTKMAMVFQDPMSSLNPTLRVGRQLAEVSELHEALPRRTALERARDRLRSVQIPDPSHRARQYPHEFSGGMRQRAMIAMALMGSPALIIADEPTTSLDVTVQREILQLLRRVNESGTALILISHDISVIAQLCQRVLVMYAGNIVESLTIDGLSAPAHPYTRALIDSLPDAASDRERPLATIPGHPPSPLAISPGCAFAQRCGQATKECFATQPPLVTIDTSRTAACWHPLMPGSRRLPSKLGI